MKKVIIVHQWMAGAEGDWRPWLKKELEKKGFQVIVPQMPDMDVPVIEKWVNKLRETAGEIDEETYFIGHSIGCQTILRCLEKRKEKIGGILLIAPWFKLKNLEDEETKKIAEPWLKTPIKLENIKKISKKTIAVFSSDDPFVVLDETEAEKFIKRLGASIIKENNKGHFEEKEYPQFLGYFEELKE